MSDPLLSHLHVEKQGDVSIVRLLDPKILDEARVQEISDQLLAVVDQGGQQKLLLNLGSVEFLSSAAIALLINLHKKLQGGSGQLQLCAVQPQVLDVLKLTQLHKLFEIYAEERDALKSV